MKKDFLPWRTIQHYIKQRVRGETINDASKKEILDFITDEMDHLNRTITTMLVLAYRLEQKGNKEEE